MPSSILAVKNARIVHWTFSVISTVKFRIFSIFYSTKKTAVLYSYWSTIYIFFYFSEPLKDLKFMVRVKYQINCKHHWCNQLLTNLSMYFQRLWTGTLSRGVYDWTPQFRIWHVIVMNLNQSIFPKSLRICSFSLNGNI